jgi:uncharacterized protein
MHAVNNMLVITVIVLSGNWSQAFIQTETTRTPAALLLAGGVYGIALALILWQAKRAGVQPYYQPRARPLTPSSTMPAPTYPLSQYPG